MAHSGSNCYQSLPFSSLASLECMYCLQNILLTRECRAKIADVGLAQLLAGQGYVKDSCQGTFAWAGERALGAGMAALLALNSTF